MIDRDKTTVGRTRLLEKVERQARRMKKAERERATWLSHTIYIGILGLVFILPVILGGYIGLWFDERGTGYSVLWTVLLIVAGVGVGTINVYLLIRR